MASVETVNLPTIPGLGTLYAQGLAGAARNLVGLKAPTNSQDLPNVVYQVTGVDTAKLGAHLRDYQELVHEAPSDTLPSGYLHVLAFPLAMAVMVRPDFPLPLLGMVHLANDASLYLPVKLGDELEVRAWAENLRPHPKGTQVDLVGEVWVVQPDGAEPKLAWHGVSTYLAKGVEAEATGPDQTPGKAARTDAKDNWKAPYPTGRWNLPGGTGREYGAISGDRNPIHLSALSAKAFGFPRAIAHGMYTAARALAEVGPDRGDTYRWTVDFAKPVLLPGKVDVAITPMIDDNPLRAASSHKAVGYTYQGWNAKKNLRHFTGTVTPL